MKLDTSTINNNQFRALLVCSTWPTAINYASGMLAREVGRDMWISGIISVLSTIMFVYIMVYIGRSFPEKTVVEYSQDIIWLIPGKVLGFILFLYFFVNAANTISMYIHHLTDFLLPETPFLVITILHVAVVCYLFWKGPQVIARLGVIGFALAIVFYFFVFLASLSEVNFDRLRPFFDSGVLAVTKSSMSVDTFTGVNQLIVAMLMPMILNKNKAFRSAATGTAIGGGFLVFYFIVELMVMGPQVVALMRIASMDFVRSIQITQYLHRFESFMVALWYWSILVRAGILAYCSLKAFSQTFGADIQKKKINTILVLIFGVAFVICTYLIAYDRVFFLNYREFTWVYISLPVQYGVPLLLLIAFILRKAFGGNKSKKNKNSNCSS